MNKPTLLVVALTIAGLFAPGLSEAAKPTRYSKAKCEELIGRQEAYHRVLRKATDACVQDGNCAAANIVIEPELKPMVPLEDAAKCAHVAGFEDRRQESGAWVLVLFAKLHVLATGRLPPDLK